MRGYIDKKVKHDSSQVLWQAYIYEGDGASEREPQIVGVHECDDADYAKFHKPSDSAAARIAELKANHALMCLNKKDNKGNDAMPNLYGPDENYPNRRIELMYRPCEPVKMDPTTRHLHEDACFVAENNAESYERKLNETIAWLT